MITVLVGDDSFAINEHLSAIKDNFDGEVERIDGSSLELRQLPDILMGSSLFSEKRLVVVRDLSKNSAVWGSFPEWIDRISDDIHLVLVEDKLDKRTQAYKDLKSKAELHEKKAWGDRDYHLAETWVGNVASGKGLNIDNAAVRHLVQRVGLDKWRLSEAVEMLSLLEAPVNKEIIDDTIVASVTENVFALFESAIKGDTARVQSMISGLELQEDPYAIFGIIVSQAVQLLAISRASDDDTPEKDFAIHPFVASKLKQSARARGAAGVEYVVRAVARADEELKSTSVDPWLIIERTLIDIAQKK